MIHSVSLVIDLLKLERELIQKANKNETFLAPAHIVLRRFALRHVVFSRIGHSLPTGDCLAAELAAATNLLLLLGAKNVRMVQGMDIEV